VEGIQGRRHKQLLDNLKEARGNWKLKAVERTASPVAIRPDVVRSTASRPAKENTLCRPSFFIFVLMFWL
jgi:hypothetical protein